MELGHAGNYGIWRHETSHVWLHTEVLSHKNDAPAQLGDGRRHVRSSRTDMNEFSSGTCLRVSTKKRHCICGARDGEVLECRAPTVRRGKTLAALQRAAKRRVLHLQGTGAVNSPRQPHDGANTHCAHFTSKSRPCPTGLLPLTPWLLVSLRFRSRAFSTFLLSAVDIRRISTALSNPQRFRQPRLCLVCPDRRRKRPTSSQIRLPTHFKKRSSSQTHSLCTCANRPIA